MKFELQKAYAFDLMNLSDLREDGTYTVQLLDIKKRLFKKPIYTVISLQTGNIIKCSDKLLSPLCKDELSIYLRFPKDSPVITDEDYGILKFLIDVTSDYIHDENVIKQIKKLELKIKYYNKIKNI